MSLCENAGAVLDVFGQPLRLGEVLSDRGCVDTEPMLADGMVRADHKVDSAQFLFHDFVALLPPISQPIQTDHLS